MSPLPSPVTTPSDTPRTGTSRRTLVRASAWSVPAVAVAAAAPAFATSTPPSNPLKVPDRVSYWIELPLSSTGEPLAVPQIAHCGSATSLTSFQIGVIGRDLDTSVDRVTVTLPAGLSFVSGNTAEVVPDEDGAIVLPTLVATGASGTYMIAARFHDQTMLRAVEVLPASGSVVEVIRTVSTSSTNGTFSTQPVVVGLSLAGAVSGSQGVAGATNTLSTRGAVIDETADSRVKMWGTGFGGTRVMPAVLTFAENELTSMTQVDTWTSKAVGTWTHHVGGAATDGTHVHAWFCSHADTTTLPLVAEVTGLSGTVLAIGAEEGLSYALTSTGLFWWSSRLVGTTVAATPVAGTAGGTLLSTWGYHNPLSSSMVRVGGAVVVGQRLLTWDATSTVTGATASAFTEFPRTTSVALPDDLTGSVRRLAHFDSGTLVLTSTGELWTHGLNAQSNEATPWHLRTTDVADVTAWGYETSARWFGGVWIDAHGRPVQFHSDTTWAERPVLGTDGTRLSSITKTYASDGTYLALSASGEVYAWGGNLDNPGRTAATLVQTAAPGQMTVDLNVWGYHYSDASDRYTGGGYVINRSAC